LDPGDPARRIDEPGPHRGRWAGSRDPCAAEIVGAFRQISGVVRKRRLLQLVVKAPPRGGVAKLSKGGNSRCRRGLWWGCEKKWRSVLRQALVPSSWRRGLARPKN